MTQNEAIKGQYMVSVGGEAMMKRLVATEDFEMAYIETMSPRELFQTWLEHEGFIGYSSTIIEMLRESGFVVEAVEKGGSSKN